MEKLTHAQRDIKRGNEYPYDGRMPPEDWAHSAARGVLANLCDRRGIKQELAQVDEDIRREIVESLAEIIREAENTK